MATGLAVVATKVGGNPEVVVDGATGLLVPPRDPAALAAALLRLRRDAGERARMGQAGRARVEEHFDVRRMVASYENLYAACGPLTPTPLPLGERGWGEGPQAARGATTQRCTR